MNSNNQLISKDNDNNKNYLGEIFSTILENQKSEPPPMSSIFIGELAGTATLLYLGNGVVANMLLKEGIYVIGFFFPVVPKGKARIRVQLSAAHSVENLNKAVDAFTKIGKKLNII